MSYFDRMTVPVHDIQEFHEYDNLETGRRTLQAERLVDYDTHDKLPMHILIHDRGTFTMYSARSKGADAYYNASDRRDTTEVRLTLRYIPQNTATCVYETVADLVEETSLGWVRVIATRGEHNDIHLKVVDISERYAELILSSHENFGQTIDTTSWSVLKQLSNPTWAFKVFSKNNRYE